MENRIKGAIYGFVVGDAMGNPYESYRRSIIENSGVKIMKKSLQRESGTFSDETSLMLATMDSIVKNEEINFDDMMKKYSNWLFDGEYTTEKKAFGIRETVFNAVNKYKNGLDINFCGDDFEDNSDVSALIRILPVCIFLYKKYGKDFYNNDDALYYLFGVTELTNKQDTNLIGIIYFSSLISNLFENANLNTALDITNNFITDIFKEEECFYNFQNLLNIKNLEKTKLQAKNNIISILECIVYSLINGKSFEESLIKSIELGGQTDTVGAITGGLAGALYGYENVKWIEKLNGKEIIDKIYDGFKCF